MMCLLSMSLQQIKRRKGDSRALRGRVPLAVGQERSNPKQYSWITSLTLVMTYCLSVQKIVAVNQ